MKLSRLFKDAMILARLKRSSDTQSLALLARIARHLGYDYRFTWNQFDWINDPEFNGILDKFGERQQMNTHRRFALWHLIRMTSTLPGDTAECGSYYGCGSYLIMSQTRKMPHPAHHFIFDSFEGLSEPADTDGGHWTQGDMSVQEGTVIENLKPFESGDYTLLKGWIPDRFPDVADRRFKFVHVDVDLLDPTRESMAFFYERLEPGGVIVNDDYGFTTCPGATKACDDFLADKPEKMIALADGGGFLIKGQTVAI